MILATVSDGATICFVILGIAAGLCAGLAVREQAYSRDIAVGEPDLILVLTSDTIGQGQVALLGPEEFEQLVGVSPRRLRELLTAQ